ncbi:DUF3592 domain-containing protein [Haloarchaeobius litoreus]|uniref:DUF3592 domain-containing protein n=1 Tax=Haloarchaeobius litoreus TaxID=755306 RepID=A0ABD6DQE6_9EURY|nr:DUF3592 domain-containing protein [Haloarchaeobius litoreus]
MTPKLDISVPGRTPGPLRGGLLVVLVGCLLVGYGAYDYHQQSEAMRDAVEVNATVVETGVADVPQRRGRTDYRPTATYEYRYGGETYTSHNVYPGSTGPTFGTRDAAESELARYEVNGSATAYVDPGSPGEAFLTAQRTNTPLKFVGIGGFMSLVGLGSSLRSFLGG